MVLTRADLKVVQASRNIGDLCGQAVGEVIGRELCELLPEVSAALDRGSREELGEPRFLGTAMVGAGLYELVAHGLGDRIILELEEGVQGPEPADRAIHGLLSGFVGEIQTVDTTEGLAALAAREIRRMTGFDRVLVYRFDEDWTGTAIAEDRNDVLPSYFDLRFPASDIPAQARELYRRNRVRIIPDIGYEPVPIEPATAAPLDLSLSVLRSVSPVHLEYMRNMGAHASMSISILRGDRLWGLVACHNRVPRRVSLRTREACDLLTRIFSMQADARERAEEAEEGRRLAAIQVRLLGFMAEEERFLDGLIHHPAELLDLAGAQGAAVLSGEDCWLVGSTPREDAVRQIVHWLAATTGDEVFATDALSSLMPEAAAFAEHASGMLAISISKVHTAYVLWFRRELVREVTWAGKPAKAVEESEGGIRLHPRKSFAAWSETVRGRSQAWRAGEVEAVKELRNSVLGIVLRKAEELASLAEDLQRSNKELEAFSYSVSHDLRAPFRHISGFAELLLQRESDRLTERGRHYVATIIASATWAGTLVDNLLRFAQLGRASLTMQMVNTRALVEELRQQMSAAISDRRVEWHIGDLAPVYADPLMFRLVLENLLSNALKYTQSRDKAFIRITCRDEGDETVLSVKDNGVGFDMAYAAKLFGVFQRLHRMEDFEGTGIGLANVRRIVERHGGRVWAEGALNQGATFSLALPKNIGA